ncbi:Uncharacterised protein [Mycobacterium tuberculosis]|nr:Uncharacterised protein [Mycobacterium tuberculosis]
MALSRWRSVSKLSSTAIPLAMPSMKSALAMVIRRRVVVGSKCCAIIAHAFA